MVHQKSNLKANLCSKLQSRDKIPNAKQPNIRDNISSVGKKTPRVINSGIKTDRREVEIPHRTDVIIRDPHQTKKPRSTVSRSPVTCKVHVSNVLTLNTPKPKNPQFCLNCSRPMVEVKDPIAKKFTGYLWRCNHCMPTGTFISIG